MEDKEDRDASLFLHQFVAFAPAHSAPAYFAPAYFVPAHLHLRLLTYTLATLIHLLSEARYVHR